MVRGTLRSRPGSPGVGPGGYGDAVLSLSVHVDQGHAGGRTPVDADEPDVDPVALEVPDGLVPEEVIADAGHESHGTAGPGGGHGLIGPLAAGGHGEFSAQDGLARPGNAGHPDDHVGVGAADDQDALHGPG